MTDVRFAAAPAGGALAVTPTAAVTATQRAHDESGERAGARRSGAVHL